VEIDGLGRITIRTLEDGGEVLVAVENNGRGIPPNRLEICEPTFTTKGDGIGTGLVLFTCDSIMRQHEGRIEVESEYGTKRAASVSDTET
jgi:signal transduction histidine kinase